MAGTYIKDLPSITDVQENDEFIIERIEGDVRTTGKINAKNLLGKLIPTPSLDSFNYDSGTQTLAIQGLGLLKEGSKIYIDDTLQTAASYSFKMVLDGDDVVEQIRIVTNDLLESASTVTIKVKNLYKEAEDNYLIP